MNTEKSELTYDNIKIKNEIVRRKKFNKAIKGTKLVITKFFLFKKKTGIRNWNRESRITKIIDKFAKLTIIS